MNTIDRAERRLAEEVAIWSRAMGSAVEPRRGLVHERATLLGLPAPGPVSSNGSCRMIRACDGWLAVNLPRAEDRATVPALLGVAIADRDPWEALEERLRKLGVAEVLADARLLGLAITAVGETPAPAPGVPADVGPAHAWDRPPWIVDLSALWAGPLCASLLAQAGCDVLKIESRQRPDTTRTRSPAFDALLNGGKRRWLMDRDDVEDRSRLAKLVATADVVVTSARQRALGWLAELLPPACCWIAIRAHGDGERIGFGDDCAAAGGLVTFEDGAPRFAGDAAADPLAGLAAAVAAFRALALNLGGRHDIALSTVAAWAAHG